MSFIRRYPNRVLAVLSFAGIASTSYLYYRRRGELAVANQTFQITVPTRDASGNRVTTTRTLPLIKPTEYEQRLTMFSKMDGALRDGIQWNWHTAQVAANNPIEDAFQSIIVQRDPPSQASAGDTKKATDSPTGDLLFFTVLDGHGGPFTSRLLSKTLIPMVALELSSLMHERVPESVPTASNSFSHLRSWFSPTPNTPPSSSRTFDQVPTYVSLAIQTAFAKLDSELINAPLRLLESLKKPKAEGDKKLSDDPLSLATVHPALSGSCALLALLDTRERNMYVACTGDSRAVAGYFDQDKGTWAVEVLTEDQTGRNPNELKRMQSEHPTDESDTVIRRGRVLGGLEPTRAFGDARYKWSREIQEQISETFFPSNVKPRPPPSSLKTPPYVTSQPVVTYRTEFIPPPTAPLSTKGANMRFLILATDGLWDTISSQDACALVAGHLAGMRGSIPKRELDNHLKLVVGAQGIDGKDKKKKKDEAGSWVFKDTNLATHLIRNAFGGGNEEKTRELLSIPPPLARSYRDDTTVTVVWWEEGKETEKYQVRAKL